MIFPSNTKFDENLESCSLQHAQSITTKFCTHHDSHTVVLKTRTHKSNSQYHGCWWPGDIRSQGISNHGIDLFNMEYSSFNTTMFSKLQTRHCNYNHIIIMVTQPAAQLIVSDDVPDILHSQLVLHWTPWLKTWKSDSCAYTNIFFQENAFNDLKHASHFLSWLKCFVLPFPIDMILPLSNY